MELGCVVHDRKYLSKFHGTINQLRRTNEFQISTLQQLPKRCCSCHGQQGKRSFDIDQLRELCQDIEQPQDIKPVTLDPVELGHYVILQSSSSLSVIEQQRRIGRFVGRDGERLIKLEQKLHASIHIINDKSSKDLQKSVHDLRERYCKNKPTDLLVVFMIQNNDYNPGNIDQIKQSLEKRWHNLDMTMSARKRPRVPAAAFIMAPSIPIHGDTRWRPKRRIPKTKQKLIEKQQAEQEKVLAKSFTNSTKTTNSKKRKR